MKGTRAGYFGDLTGKTYKNELLCSRIVATAERSGGNDQVGDMWLETRSFPADTTAREIIEWAVSVDISGRLIITPDLATEGEARP